MQALAPKWAFLLTVLAVPLGACQTATTSGAAAELWREQASADLSERQWVEWPGRPALSPAETTQVRQYVVAQQRPSVRVTERVVVGEPLPPRVRIYPVPASVGLQREYGYTVVNGQTVLVDPQTREVVTFVE